MELRLRVRQPATPRQNQRTSADTDSQAPQKLDKIEVTRTKELDDRQQSTVTKIIVTHDDIVRFGDTRLADVLKRVPGITIGGVRGQVADIRMRGLGSGYVQILLDGEPTPPGFSLDLLAPDLIERIEVLRAPTADISAQAIAGTINIVLRRTVQKGQRNLKVVLAEENGRPSSSANVQLSDRVDAWSYTVAAVLSREKYDDPAEAEQIGSDAQGNVNLVWLTKQTSTPVIDTISLAPRINWQASNGDTVASDTFVRYQQIQSIFSEKTTTLLGAPPTYASDDLAITYDTTIARTRLDWVHRWSDGASLETKFGVNYNHRNGDARFHGFDDSGIFILDRSVRSGATTKGFTTTGKYLTPFATGHALAIGWDDEYSQRDESRIQRDITPTGLPPDNIDENYETRLWRAALFAQDEWDVTPRLSAYAGLRWEGLDTRTAGNVISEVHNRSNIVSPVLQMLWKLPDTDSDQVRFSVARTYKAPTTAQLTPRRYVANNNTATTPDLQGNPDLHPELAWGVDVAYEHALGDGGILGASAFVRRIDSVILHQLVNVDGIWISTPANEGNASVQGFELEAKFNIRTLFKTGPNLNVRANLARNWSRVDGVPGPDNRLDRQTPFSSNLGFDYLADGIPLTVGVNFGFQTGGPVRVSLTQTSDTPVKRVLDAYALWKFDPRTQLRVSLANVLHQNHVARLGYFDDNGALRLTTTAPTYVTVAAALEMTF